jgi:hypothetical protein
MDPSIVLDALRRLFEQARGRGRSLHVLFALIPLHKSSEEIIDENYRQAK